MARRCLKQRLQIYLGKKKENCYKKKKANCLWTVKLSNPNIFQLFRRMLIVRLIQIYIFFSLKEKGSVMFDRLNCFFFFSLLLMASYIYLHHDDLMMVVVNLLMWYVSHNFFFLTLLADSYFTWYLSYFVQPIHR